MAILFSPSRKKSPNDSPDISISSPSIAAMRVNFRARISALRRKKDWSLTRARLDSKTGAGAAAQNWFVSLSV
jgi:hypothetical protein